ncbi:M24 family metallopeptidase [Nioella sediminis]|jgi:Xaa-Pro aminopeptidase|uniref:M24 family metallopeptidase n=1 Tax=Nioella sediminis TaxID=1912092 RepID=UPI0008FCE16B|nr:Xaa-Pro peptidase family protein [Nioella sediminis]TBX28447.1 peptidase M24 [Roseovarius sp. JS7-11]
MTRGFPEAEFAARVARAQALMADHGLAALLLTTEPEVRYFTGYITRFWESPTRPWFVVLPASGKPIAVIPAIGAPVMARTWVEDIRTWRAPDLSDDGVSLLADTLREVAGDGPVGLPMGHETHLRMPLADYARLGESVNLVSDQGIMRSLRLVKSEAEIDKIRTACAVAGRAFDRVGEIAAAGVPLSQVFRRFQMLCLEEGADWVPYLAGGAGPLGYDDVISPASDTPLAVGDVLMLDTGLVVDGYFCDYDRNFGIGAVDPRCLDGHRKLIEAVDRAMEIARPGATAADLFHAMDTVLTGSAGGSEAGRYGHGLGMQLTEWPSLIPDDHTVLQPGMVLTLEPGVEIADGQVLVHEENIVIREAGPERLSPFSAPELRIL